MGREQVAAETTTLAANPETLVLALLHFVADPGHINAFLYCFVGVLKLPPDHLGGSRGRPNLLNEGEYLSGTVRLNH